MIVNYAANLLFLYEYSKRNHLSAYTFEQNDKNMNIAHNQNAPKRKRMKKEKA